MSPSGELDPQAALLQGSAAELMQFTVLGIIDSVMLVLHKTTNETYILKVCIYFLCDVLFLEENTIHGLEASITTLMAVVFKKERTERKKKQQTKKNGPLARLTWITPL